MVTAALIIFSAAIAALLLAGARVRLRLRAELFSVRLRAEAALLFGLVNIRAEASAAWFPLSLRVNGKKPRPRRKKKKSASLSGALYVLRRAVKTERLIASGGAGVRGDAAAGVILTGIMRETIRAVSLMLRCGELELELAPALERDMFCINLEGILKVDFTQIIYAVLRRTAAQRRERNKNHDASC